MYRESSTLATQYKSVNEASKDYCMPFVAHKGGLIKCLLVAKVISK